MSQKSGNGHLDDTNSPISRTGTPNMYNPHGMAMFHGMDDTQFQSQPLPEFGVTGTSPGRAGSPNGNNVPQTHDQLMAANATLKTRVSELEVIQELFRGRLQQLESEQQAREMSGSIEPQLRSQVTSLTEIEAQLRSQLSSLTECEDQLRKELDESHRRENMLKRRLDEMELELKSTQESLEAHENGRAKKSRLDDGEKKDEEEQQPNELATQPEAPAASPPKSES